MIDNDKLAAAIVAMYKVFDGHDWDDTSELVQKAAFALWEKSDWEAERMAAYLVSVGKWSVDVAASFTDISTERARAAVWHYAQLAAQEAL